MKKRRKRKNSDYTFADVLGELVFILVVLVVAMFLMWLVPRDWLDPIGGEGFVFGAYLGLFLIYLSVSFCIRFFKKKRAIANAEDGKKVYKTYHCFYKTIYQLYDDLKDTVTNIRLEDEEIYLSYQTTTMMIRKGFDEYYTYLNGVRENICLEDKDIYHHALEFAHDNIKSGSEMTISDEQIVAVRPNEIIYTDSFDRRHCVDLSSSAKHYAQAQAYDTITKCVGERNILNPSFTFYSFNIKIKVVFESKRIFGTKKHFLYGNKIK